MSICYGCAHCGCDPANDGDACYTCDDCDRPDNDPCNYCLHDNADHRGDGCLYCGCVAAQ